MRQAIGEYVEREERREAFKVAGAEAWSRYVTTGHYVPKADADAWLAKLTEGRYAESPACKKADAIDMGARGYPGRRPPVSVSC